MVKLNRGFCLLFIVLLFPFNAFCIGLRFQYLNGDQFSYAGTSQQTVILNGAELQVNENQLTSDYTVSVLPPAEPTLTVHTAVTTVSKGPHASAQDSQSINFRYSIDPLGTYSVEPGLELPTVRNVPSFPSTDLTDKQTWSAPGTEMEDLSNIAIFAQNKKQLPLVVVNFPVNYIYKGEQLDGGQKVQVVQLNYNIFERPNFSHEDFKVYPILITGSTTETISFDNTLGLIKSAHQEYILDLLLSNGDYYEFIGKNQNELRPVSLENRPLPIPPPIPKPVDIEVVVPKVVIHPSNDALVEPDIQSLGTIGFDANSSRVRADQIDKIKQIALVILHHNKKEILIEGFVAAIGTIAQQARLAQERAQSIASYLVALGVSRDDLIVSGMGARKPIASNSNPDGRAQNRRVEMRLLIE